MTIWPILIIPGLPALAALAWLAVEWRRALAQFELAGRGVELEQSHDL